jgi:DDE superfamily endonuclease
LTDGDKALNGLLSSARIVVEHTLSGVKRSRSVKDVLRNTKHGFSDLVMEVACALHNLRIAIRHPLPTLDIVALAS